MVFLTRRCFVSRLRDQRGSFYLEMMVTMTILLIMLVGLVPLLTLTATVKQANFHKAIAINIINRELEYARSLPFDSVGLQGGNPSGVIVPDRDETVDGLPIRIRNRVTWTSNETDTVDPVPDPTAYKKVTVTIMRASDMKVLGSASTSISRQGEKPVGSGAHLRVVAKRSDGTPVENVSISIVSGPRGDIIPYPITNHTDSYGETIFADLEPSEVGNDYQITAALDGFVVRPDQVVQTMTMYVGQTRTLEFILEPPGRLIVQLKDPGGSLIDKQSSIDVNNPLTGVTNYKESTGYFEISGLFPGDYEVTAKAASYAPTPSPVTAIVESDEDTHLDIILQPRMRGNLHLEVFDAADGARIQPDDVKATNISTGEELHFSTNGNGVLETPLEVGDYRVEVSKNGYEPSNDLVTITASGNTFLTVELARTPSLGSIAVRAERFNGRPRNGVRILVEGPGGYSQTAWTGYSVDPETGRTVPGEAFFTDLQPGEYTVYRYNWGWKYPRQVTVIGGQRSRVVYTY